MEGELERVRKLGMDFKVGDLVEDLGVGRVFGIRVGGGVGVTV